MVDTSRPVTGGVDTHLDLNVVAVLDGIGGLLGVEQFPTTTAGNKAAAGVAGRLGDRWCRVGVEGTGSYGAPLARYLGRAGVAVVEVDRPNRQERRRKGKTDTVDAMRRPTPPRVTASWEQAKHPRRPRGSHPGVGGRQAVGEVHQDQEPQPDPPSRLHRPRRDPPVPARPAAPNARSPSRPPPCGPPPTATTRWSSPPRQRSRTLWADGCWPSITETDRPRPAASASWSKKSPPDLLSLYGVGIDSAAALLVTAGDNPDRLRCEATWATLCRVSPIEASSGKITRHRLNRGGNRQANAALWGVVITRLVRSDPRTQAYMARRTQGRPSQARDHQDAQTLRRPRGLQATFLASKPA